MPTKNFISQIVGANGLTASPSTCPHEILVARMALEYVRQVLTPGEYKVVGLRAQGYTLREIGDRYALSAERVRTYQMRAMGKMQRRYRTLTG